MTEDVRMPPLDFPFSLFNLQG